MSGASQPTPIGALSAEDLITLNEEIAGMARAGLPLDQGLAVLAREMGRGRLRAVTQSIADDLRSGFTLPQALARQEGRVPPYYAALLAAGIRSGRLGEVLGTLTVYARSLADFRSHTVTALIYPVMILLIGLALLYFVGQTVLPMYATIFHDMKLRMPLATQILVFLNDHALVIFVLPTVLLLVTVLIARWWLKATPGGRVLWARVVYALPIVGTLIRSARLSAFADLLGLLVDQEVPLPEGFRLAAAASSDPLLVEGAKQIDADLQQGVPLGQSLRRQRLVPDLIVWMITTGEKQASLGPTLHQIALTYRRQMEVRSALLRVVLPPLLILLLAATLGLLFIFGLIEPMYALMEDLSGGGKK